MAGMVVMRLFVAVVALTSLVCLVYVYAFPPESLRLSREGVPYFTPPVMHPETGEPIDVRTLVRHYRGD